MIVDLRPTLFDAVVSLGVRMNSESPVYSGQHIDYAYTASFFTRAWDVGVLIGAVDTDSHGCLIGSVSPTWYSPSPIASEWMLYVVPEHRGTGLAVKLIQRFTEIARQRGAHKLYVGSSTGINDEGVRKLYERLGFVSVGSALAKEL